MSVGDNDLKTVALDKTGVVRVYHDGTLHTLRRPRWGEYRAIRDSFKASTPLDRRRLELSQALAKVQDGTDTTTPTEQITADVEELLKLTDEVSNLRGETIRIIFNGNPNATPPIQALADQPLPDNPDNWEVWLLADENLLNSWLEHWRSVPLARGG